MNTFITHRGQRKNQPGGKSKFRGWTISDLLYMIVLVAVMWYLVSHKKWIFTSAPMVSEESRDKVPQVAPAKIHQIEEFKRLAGNSFMVNFSEALEKHRQGMLDAGLAASLGPLNGNENAGSGLTATGSKVYSINISWPDNQMPSSAEDAFNEIARYVTVYRINWKGPGDCEGYCDFELVSAGKTDASPTLHLLNMEKSEALHSERSSHGSRTR